MADIKVQRPWAQPAAPGPGPFTAPSAPDGQLLEPEYRAAYSAYAAAPTPENADGLLKAVRPVLTEAARSYAGGEAGSATAMADAKRLALEAVGRYDPARAKLRTHLLSHLRGLRRQVARSAGGVYVPEQWRLDAQRLSSAVPDLADRLGREPSAAEIADHTGIGLDRVRKARSVPGVLASSQAGESRPTGGRDPEAWKTWTEAVYGDSGPVDQVILDHSFGLHGHPVLAGNLIAEKLNLSPGAVSQRRARLQRQLDEFETFLGHTGG